MENVVIRTINQMEELFGVDFLKNTLADIVNEMLENKVIYIVTTHEQRQKIKTELNERLKDISTQSEIKNIVEDYKEELLDLDHYEYENGVTCQFFYNCMNELDCCINQKFGPNYIFQYCVGDIENEIYDLGVHAELDINLYNLIELN